LIVGAGLTGLSAAERLEELGETDYVLVEAEGSPGGWAMTDRTGPYASDRAIHVLYFRDDATRVRVERLLHGDWYRHEKRCVVDSQGVRTPFPFHANLFGRPADVIADCLAGLFEAAAGGTIAPAPPDFLTWIMQSFGRGVAQQFMVPYNTKMWTVPPEKMDAHWMREFIPPVDLRRAVEGAISSRDSRVGLNAEFFYPRGGISRLAEAMAQRLNSSIRYESALRSLSLDDRTASFSDGTEIRFDTLISTVPLPSLAAAAYPLPPDVISAGRSLESLDLVLVDIAARSAHDEGVHWAYLPDADTLGYRLHAVHNLSRDLVPPGEGLFTVEIAHSGHRLLPGGSLTGRVVRDLVRTGWISSEDDVTFARQRRRPCAYAVPLLGSMASATLIRSHLEGFGVCSVGRFGEWKYSNMEDAILDGRAVAEQAFAGHEVVRA
jgi:protoporphyrinogen oxidase